jgi:hypothetical protein
VATGQFRSLVETAPNFPSVVVVDDSFVYWADQNDLLFRIMKVRKEGGEPTLVATEDTLPWALAVGPQSIYWISNDQRSSVKAICK